MAQVRISVVVTLAALMVTAASCSSSKSGQPDAAVNSGACLADRDCLDRGQLCDPARAVCVQCRVRADCPQPADCVSNACVAVQICLGSLDCKTDEVCDVARGRCVGCLTNADCGAASQCVSSVCRANCRSDLDCQSMQQLCDLPTGSCVACVRSADCGVDRYCDANTCQDAVCSPAATACVSNIVLACAPDGSGWQTQTLCPIECRVTPAGAMCADDSEAGTDAATEDVLGADAGADDAPAATEDTNATPMP